MIKMLELINSALYWMQILILPIFIATITIVIMDPFIQWRTGILLILSMLLTYRCIQQETYIGSDIYVRSDSYCDGNITNEIADYFCRRRGAYSK